MNAIYHANKNISVAILIIVTIMTFIMATGLSELSFNNVTFLSLFNFELEPSDILVKDLGEFLIPVLRFIFLTAILFMPISLIYLLSKTGERMFVIKLLLQGVLLIVLFNTLPDGFLDNLVSGMGSNSAGRSESITAVYRSFSNPPPWFVISFSLILSGLIIGFVYSGWRYVKNRSKPIDLVTREASITIEELKAGGDLRDLVTRCYFNMIKVVTKTHDFERNLSKTTRELELEFEAIGLPGDYIRRLTRLFESVRYGAKNLSKDENNEAVSCLSAIVNTCGK